MKITKCFKSILSITAIGLSLSGAAQATLYDRGNGMIYDSVLDITWLQDANYAKTSGYDSDGLMTWDAANTWAQGLNYGGYNDWRLPNVKPINGINLQNNFSYDGTTDQGYNFTSTKSEMGYMFYINLGNTGWFDTSGAQTGCSFTSPRCLTNTGLFNNLEADHRYWSSEEYAPNHNFAWGFLYSDGYKGISEKSDPGHAWAVRDGDVNPVPVPAAFWLFGTGLLALGGRKWRTNS